MKPLDWFVLAVIFSAFWVFDVFFVAMLIVT